MEIRKIYSGQNILFRVPIRRILRLSRLRYNFFLLTGEYENSGMPTNGWRIIGTSGGTERASMRLNRTLASGVLLLGFLVVGSHTARSADDLKPPSIYVDKGACPFECCTYREWVARTDLTLVDSPDGKKVVAQIKKGEKCAGLDWRNSQRPLANPRLSPRLSRCRSEGRGYHLHASLRRGGLLEEVWHDGKLVEIDNLPDKGTKPKTTWWVKLKTSSGAVGWTVEHHNFENQDACG